MQWYKEHSIIKNGAATRECDIEFQNEIVCGKFIDKDLPSYLEMRNAQLEDLRKKGIARS